MIGSLEYVRSRGDLAGVKIALFSRCLGADATIFAMARSPQSFEDVRCLIACQPLSPRMVLERTFERSGLPAELIDELDRRIRLRTSFTLNEMSPVAAAASIRVPTIVYQVRDDTMTRASDVQAMYDAIPNGTVKDVFWIEGTTRRWDGYLYFQRQPDRILDWLQQHTRS